MLRRRSRRRAACEWAAEAALNPNSVGHTGILLRELRSDSRRQLSQQRTPRSMPCILEGNGASTRFFDDRWSPHHRCLAARVTMPSMRRTCCSSPARRLASLLLLLRALFRKKRKLLLRKTAASYHLRNAQVPGRLPTRSHAYAKEV